MEGSNGRTSSVLVFFVNGEKVVDENIDPEWTLLFYLRSKLRLCGTKLGCGEGGCGACTVTVSKFDRQNNRPIHFAVNSCLTPIAAMHGLSVTTVEGIGSVKTKIHPIQERIAEAHGSQCGFCTPGFVMSMYALLRSSQGRPSMTDIEIAFQGNLCRCTGYRPIREGFKTFAEVNGCPMKDQCCRIQNKNTSNNGFVEEAFEQKLFDANSFAPYDPSQELIFPPELAVSGHYDEQFLKICGPRVTWMRPANLKQLLDLKAENPGAKMIGGNSEIGVEVKFKNCFYSTLISPSQVRELSEVKIVQQLNGFPSGPFLKIGGTTTLTNLEDSLKMLVKTEPEHSTRIFREILDMLFLFAGKQIRNVGTVGGNIMTGSPISDLNPTFMASGSIVELISSGPSVRHVLMDSTFWTGYRRNIIEPEEIIAAVYIPYTSKNQYFKAYKQSKRREDDIAIVNGAFFFNLNNEGAILEARLAYGGMGPVTKLAEKTAQFMQGMKWNDQLIENAGPVLLDELKLDPGAPGGMAKYRMTLALSMLFKALLSVSIDLRATSLEIDVPSTHLSGPDKFHPSEFKSSQYFSIVPASHSSVNSISRPMVHQSAFKQATGEAVYCDDIPAMEGELHLALVVSSKAHAKLLRVDPSEALSLEGVIGFLSAEDTNPERNKIGMAKDEPLLASTKVETEGQVIGLIVAEKKDLAQRAAKLVGIEYEELEPIITIEQAIKAKSYYAPMPMTMQIGDISSAFEQSDHVVEGEMRVGGQEHFYLETQNSISVPAAEDDEITILASTQSPMQLQRDVAFALDLPLNKVVVKVKRLGGGFGGKETRSSGLAVYTALAARKLRRPVRLSLDRHEDMVITGQRHPFLGRYKASFMATGRITGLHIQMYCNAGWSLDMSNLVMEKAMIQVTNSFYIPNVLCEGYCCKTNLPSNTAFRGFGSPQSMIIMETIMSRISHVTGVHPNEVREINFYKNGDLTPYYQPMIDVTVQKCWQEVLKGANYDRLAEDVKQFNEHHKFRKRGISVIPNMYGIGFSDAFLNQAGALLLLYTDGTVLISHGGVEMGQGLHTKMIQVASQCLGIPVEKIHISETSTDKVPNASSTAASLSSDLYGMAILEACKTIKERLKPVVEQNPKGSWEEWVRSAYFQRISLAAMGYYKMPYIEFDKEKKKGVASCYFTSGAACSVVEIDCLTGDHQVIRTDIVMDVGESLNPAIDVGQIEGAFMQGYGLYTMEEPVVSPSGSLLSRGPGTYKIPGFTDIPLEFNVSLLRGMSNPRAVYSSKAIGEPPLFSSASVFFAIRDAIHSYRFDNGHSEWFSLDSPATAERIRLACEDKFCEITKTMVALEQGTYTSWNVSP